ncbi:hypothetical protein [Staphylococcus caprae]|uniref:hypothetical protein n=1 Tax=Staphylococcus caprae TaxID=29380 RepID=UPI003B213C75
MKDFLKSKLGEFINLISELISNIFEIDQTKTSNIILNIFTVIAYIIEIAIFITLVVIIIYIISLVIFPVIAIFGYFKDKKRVYDQKEIENSRKGKGNTEVYITYYIWQRQKKEISRKVLGKHTKDNLVVTKSKWVLFPYKKKVWGYL